MKRLFATALLCAAIATAAAQNTQRNEWMPEFTAVKVSAAIEIKFVQVPETEAPRIVYDTKGVEDTKFKAGVDKKGVLTVTEKILRDKRSQTVVEVYYHSLESLEVSDAYVEFDNTVKEKMMRIDISGGAKLAAEVDITDLEIGLSGKNTRAKFTGKARYVEISASSGLLDASEMEAMSVDVVSNYGAGVAVRVSERLKAAASTSATISYRGTPTIIKGRASVLGGSVKEVTGEE